MILRNLRISRVDASNGDAIGLDKALNVWVDHCDLSGDLNVDKDEYDGLLDITHASDWITVTNTYFHDHVSNHNFPGAEGSKISGTDNYKVERFIGRAFR